MVACDWPVAMDQVDQDAHSQSGAPREFRFSGTFLISDSGTQLWWSESRIEKNLRRSLGSRVLHCGEGRRTVSRVLVHLVHLDAGHQADPLSTGPLSGPAERHLEDPSIERSVMAPTTIQRSRVCI
jgi:hypothetical protein